MSSFTFHYLHPVFGWYTIPSHPPLKTQRVKYIDIPKEREHFCRYFQLRQLKECRKRINLVNLKQILTKTQRPTKIGLKLKFCVTHIKTEVAISQ